VTRPPEFSCPACQANEWEPFPLDGVYGCRRCRFAVDKEEPIHAALERATRWKVFPSVDAGLPPRLIEAAANESPATGARDFLPGIDSALRAQQERAVQQLRLDITDAEVALATLALMDGGNRNPSDEEVLLCAQLARLSAGGRIPPEARVRRGCALTFIGILALSSLVIQLA